MSTKAVILDHVGDARCNFGDFEESINSMYALELDGKAQSYWRILAATKERPAGVRKTDARINQDVASVVDADAYGPEVQNADPTAPGYNPGNNAAVARLNEARAENMVRLLATTKADIKNEDRKRVEKEDKEFGEQAPVVYAFLKARLSTRVLSALEATDGFGAIAASHDATGLWKAIVLKYGKGTTGAAHLAKKACDEIDKAITGLKIQRGEDLHGYYKRFTTLLRQAKLADRPDIADEWQVFYYLQGLAGHLKYGRFKQWEDQAAIKRAQDHEEGEADMTLVRIHNRALEYMSTFDSGLDGSASQTHAFPAMAQGELDTVETDSIKKAGEQQAAERELGDRISEAMRAGNPKLAESYIYAAMGQAKDGRDNSGGRGGNCANCLRHGDYDRSHPYWRCTEVTGRALAPDLQQRDQEVKAKKEAAKDAKKAKELADLAAAAKKAQEAAKKAEEARDKLEKEILYGNGAKKASKYFDVRASPPVCTLDSGNYPAAIELPARLVHCLTAVRDRPCPGHDDPFDLNHAIFDNQAGVSMVRDSTLLRNIRPLGRTVTIGGVNAGSPPLEATEGGDLGDFGFVLLVPDAACQVIAQATCEQRRYPVYMTGGVTGHAVYKVRTMTSVLTFQVLPGWDAHYAANIREWANTTRYCPPQPGCCHPITYNNPSVAEPHFAESEPLFVAAPALAGLPAESYRPPTVAGNAAQYSRQDVRGAAKARELERRLGMPSTARIEAALPSLINAEVTAADLRRHVAIGGKPVAKVRVGPDVAKRSVSVSPCARPNTDRPSPRWT